MREISALRDIIHKKSHELHSFRFERRPQKDWDKFYGCLDSLLDADTALHRIGKENRAPTMLECYGFLIVLVIQQDAVEHLSKSVDLMEFNPRDIEPLNKIRYLRHKIAAHSPWSDKEGISSSIIDWASITEKGFSATIYGGNRTDIGDNGTVYIDFQKLIMDNDTALIIQLEKVVKKMDDLESNFKAEHRGENLTSLFEKDAYIIQRLHCNLKDSSRIGQALGHARILKNNLNKLVRYVSEKKVHEISRNNVKRCLYGLEILVQILENTRKQGFKLKNQWKFDLVFGGWEQSYESLKLSVNNFEVSLHK